MSFRLTRHEFLKSIAGLGAVLSAPRLLADTAPEVHVAPGGDDANPGTRERPVRTLAGARALARQRRGATVWLADGLYEERLLLEAADAGSRWQAEPGARPRLTTSRRVTAADFGPVRDAAARARLQPAVRDRIVALDLKQLGFQHINRYPDVFVDNGGLIELFVDRRRMPLARYPKDDFMRMRAVRVNDGGPKDRGAAVQRPGGVFEYRDPRTERWAAAVASGLWLKGYWRIPWQNEAVRVAEIDTAQQTIALAAPVPGGIGNKYHRPAGDGNEPYYAFNLLEELDRPGEWCIDFTTATLYFYPPRPLAQLDIRIADETAPAIELVDTSGVEISGLEIGECLGDGIGVSEGRGNRIAGCRIANVTRYGIRLAGGRQHEALGNDIHDTGAGGIWLGGGDDTATPRVPAGHRAVNNHIWNFGVIERVYAPGINAGFTGGGGGGHHAAVGMVVTHNLIHDGPHAAILHGSWDSEIAYNELFRYCLVSNDMGAIYCYDRYSRSGYRKIHHNLMHNAPLGDGIYFDGDNNHDAVSDNIAWKIGGTAFLYKRAVEPANPLLLDLANNLAVDCRQGYRIVARQGSRIERNLAVRCTKPFEFVRGRQAVGPDAQGDVSSGRNGSYEGDPGFANPQARDFSFRPGAAPLADTGFQPISLRDAGLFVDAHRRALPTDAQVQRWSDSAASTNAASAIEDRK